MKFKWLLISVTLLALTIVTFVGLAQHDVARASLTSWTQLSLGPGCPDWTRFDGEYYAPTGLVYFMGGRSGSTYLGNIYSYDPVANTCADTGQVMIVAVANYTIGLINNGVDDLLCTFGGNYSATQASDKVQCYNPIANTVAEVSTLPGQLGQFIPGGVAVVDNTVYVFGGFRNWTTPYNISETWAYDPVANSWIQNGDINMGRGYIDVAVVDGKIYGFGGDTFDGANLIAQTITEVFDPVAGTWDDAAVAELTDATGESRAYGFDTSSVYEFAGKVIIAGGGQWPADTNAVLSYDVASDTYDVSFPDLNITRRDQAGFFVPGNPGAMWVFGGRSSAVGYGGDNPPYAPPEYFEVNVPVAQPVIAVTPSALDATLLPDATTTITLTISNTGTAPLDWSETEIPDETWLSETPTSGTVPAGGSVVVDVTFDATGLTVGQYLASLNVNSNDPVTPVVNVPVTLTVESVDLTLTKTDSPDPVKVGQDLTYTLLVTNNGLQDATGVTVVDTLPGGVTFVSASVGCAELSGVVTCDVGPLAMAGVASITIVVTPTTVGVISNTATVSGNQLDPNHANNTATQDTTVHVVVYLPITVK